MYLLPVRSNGFGSEAVMVQITMYVRSKYIVNDELLNNNSKIKLFTIDKLNYFRQFFLLKVEEGQNNWTRKTRVKDREMGHI